MKFPPFKISNLLSAEIGTIEEYDITENVWDLTTEDPSIISPLSFHIELLKAKDRIEVTFSHFSVTIKQECRKCIFPIEHIITIPFFSHTYLLTKEGIPTEELADNYLIDLKNNVVDVAEALREEILAHVDPFIVCQENCQGLCPVCGKNKNNDPCSCVVPIPTNTETYFPFVHLKDMIKTKDSSPKKPLKKSITP